MPTKYKKKSKTRALLEKLNGGPFSVGAFVRGIRESSEHTQRSLGELVDVSSSVISDIENDRRALSPRLATSIAQALGYSPNVLLAKVFEGQARKLGLALRVRVDSVEDVA